MSQKYSESNLDLKEFKERIGELKETVDKAKIEYQKNGNMDDGSGKKDSLIKKILGLILLAVIFVVGSILVFSNMDMLFLPENSIRIVVTDQNGDAINGLKLNLTGGGISSDKEFIDTTEITILGAATGNYTLIFSEIPEGYSCDEKLDKFTLEEGKKIKVKYECEKK